MGMLMAAGAVSGILGTLLYPLFRKKMGLERTGLFSFFFEISFLCLCVASVWAPGSPFDPLGIEQPSVNCVNQTYSPGNSSAENLNITSEGVATNLTGSDVQDCTVSEDRSYISVVLLMAGIIGARCGKIIQMLIT